LSIFVRIAPDLYELDAFGDFLAAPDFRLGNARALMWLSQAAYQLEDFQDFAQRGLFAAWGLQAPTPLVAKTLAVYTSGFHAFREDAAFLVFTGTDPVRWETLATDVLAIQPAHTDVHFGFLRAFEAVADDVRNFLNQVGDRKLFVAGHSLGGAIALLAARFAVDQGAKPTAIYAYGVPRVGGLAFAADYTAALGNVTYRLVHGDDLAARIPMSTITLPGQKPIYYRHVGRLLSCEAGARFDAARLSPDSTSDDPAFPTAREFFAANLAALFGKPPFQDPGLYTGSKATMARLRPASMRHHMQDQYLHALRPPARRKAHSR
jgi:pimeloyl-ACP methyl ester carboxylesterase